MVGRSVHAKLAVQDLSKWDNDDDCEVQLDCRPLHTVFAVTELASHDLAVVCCK